MKKLVIIVSAIVVIVCFVYYMSYHQYVSPQSLSMPEVIVSDESITVDGFNYGGMFNYLGYKTKYDAGKLYIAFRGGWHMPWMPETNSPFFYPIPNNFGEINEVYLTNRWFKEPRLLWEKSN